VGISIKISEPNYNRPGFSGAVFFIQTIIYWRAFAKRAIPHWRAFAKRAINIPLSALAISLPFQTYCFPPPYPRQRGTTHFLNSVLINNESICSVNMLTTCSMFGSMPVRSIVPPPEGTGGGLIIIAKICNTCQYCICYFLI
jgi:hypothetical protein